MAIHTSAAHAEWFAVEERAGLASLRRTCEQHAAELTEEVQRALAAVVPAALTDSVGWRAPGSQEVLAELRLALSGESGPFARTLAKYAARLARKGIPVKRLFGAFELIHRGVVHVLVADYAGQSAELEAALGAMHRMCERSLQTITDEYLAFREQLMQEQRRSKDGALMRFKRLYEAGVLGIVVYDLLGPIREANDAFLQMTGYTREDVSSGALDWREMTPPEWRSRDDDAVAQLKESGRTGLWEKEYYRKDGSRVPSLVSVAMLQGSECLAFMLDLTEQKRAEALRTRSIELEAENQRIQEASRLKSEFLANMSHELRTPLNSIIGFADLLYDGEVPPDSPQHRDFLGDILKSGRHLLQLINDVLDLAKIEAGKMDFRPEQTDVRRLVAEVVDVLDPIASESGIEVGQSVHPELGEVVLDPARLKQVLYNYLSNALKFTPSGGRVEVRALPVGKLEFRLEVEDSGIGIADGDLPRLFTEFEQLDHGPTKRHPGTGLGLALTKRIVEAQSGSVGVRSALGKGSVFFATLPVRATGSTARLHSVLPERFDDAPLVLVVEDDDHDRHAIVRVLNRAGYGVQVARNGREAIAACMEHGFDAITLDLMLPDLSGLEVLRRIRRDGKSRGTPVVVVSVVSEHELVQGFAVHDYLQKPVEAAKLLDSLARAGIGAERGGAILVVDGDPGARSLVERTLRSLGFVPHCHGDATSALASAERVRHAAVVLDPLTAGMDGMEFLARFRAHASHRATPVIVWTLEDLTAEEGKALKQRVQAVVAKGSGPPQTLVEELSLLVRPQRTPSQVPPP